MNGVRLITFHHSGDPKPFAATDYVATAQHLEYVREYHRSRNFQDIGYHFAIDRAGRVWQLRSLAYQGQHVRYNNEHNIGIVVLGNFDLQGMTQAQKDRIKIFGAVVRKQYGLPISRCIRIRKSSPPNARATTCSRIWCRCGDRGWCEVSGQWPVVSGQWPVVSGRVGRVRSESDDMTILAEAVFMCERCGEISRRDVLKGAALGLGAAARWLPVAGRRPTNCRRL